MANKVAKSIVEIANEAGLSVERTCEEELPRSEAFVETACRKVAHDAMETIVKSLIDETGITEEEVAEALREAWGLEKKESEKRAEFERS